MSYIRPNTGDALQDCFINWINFYNILPNLRQAKSSDEFFVWFEKLDYIDRRATFLSLLKDKEIIVPKEYRKYIYAKYQHFKNPERLLVRWNEEDKTHPA